MASELLDFDYFTLTNDQIIKASIFFTIALSCIMATAFLAFRHDTKRLAWSLSAVNSFIMSVVGIIYLWKKLPQYDNFFFFGNNGTLPWHGRCNVSVLAAIWFALANAFDLAFGSVFYPKYMGLLTGYVHHLVFIWVMITSASGNGGFIQLAPFSNAFTLMLIEEVPTFLLAFGSIFSEFRTDLGFGISFFALRIVFHLYGFIYGAKSGVNRVLLVLFTFTLFLHCLWFYGWISKYTKYSEKNKKKSV
jgi:hypothetical protein